MAAHFEPVVDANCQLVAPPPTRRTAIGGYPEVAFYDMLGEQVHYSNPVKHGELVVSLITFNYIQINHNLNLERARQFSFQI